MNLREAFDIEVPTVVLAEGGFGEAGGKTANGVVMHSEVFDVRVVVDSETAGRATSDVLGTTLEANPPVVATMEEALDRAPEVEALVIGTAPAGGALPESWTSDIRMAIERGCDVVSGLHTFFSEDDDWRAIAEEYNVNLYDVRKPPEEDSLTVARGSGDDVDASVVLTVGTDCAVGKRTTTFELYKEAQKQGIDAGWVATGQTGIMVGAHRGVVIDRVPADFTAGVVETLVSEVGADHDLVFVEGQASLAHRAYSGVTLSILHGAWPDAVVVADEPGRDVRTHYENFHVSGVGHEISAIEHLSEASAAAISTWGDPEQASDEHGLPAGNVFCEDGPAVLLEAVLEEVGQ